MENRVDISACDSQKGRIKMKYGKIAAGVLLACVLAGGSGVASAGDVFVSDKTARQVSGVPSHFYERDGLQLRVPLAYEKLLVVETPDSGQLFSVSEKASLEAGLKENPEFTGAGWLFGIGRVTEEELHEMLCMDMSGRELFAKDGAGNGYIYYHPTDVRYMRETPEAMEREQPQWERLCAWANDEVRAAFVRDNAELSPWVADNSEVGIFMANILYHPGVKYTLGRAGEEPVPGDGFPAGTYGEKLLYGCEFRMIKKGKAPKGDYVVLEVPGAGVELDFYKQGEDIFVREKRAGLPDNFYEAVSRVGKTDALQVMKDWQEALAADRDLGKLGFAPEAGKKGWSEKLDRRGNLNLTGGAKGSNSGVQVAISLSTAGPEVAAY